MAQGSITRYSRAPEDARQSSEAAGITRFKAQKREAIRKLEGTEQNLLRVADLIREVKRQIISLQRQAGKARRYKQYMAELQHLDTQLARHQYDVSQLDIEEGRERIEALRGEIETCSGEVVRGEEEVSQLRERLAIEARSRRVNRRAGIKGGRSGTNIEFRRGRLRELAARNEGVGGHRGRGARLRRSGHWRRRSGAARVGRAKLGMRGAETEARREGLKARG